MLKSITLKFITLPAAICITLVLSACTQTTVTSVDFTQQEGIYIVGYSDDAALRNMMEDQLVADLSARGITAIASNAAINNIVSASAQDVIGAAQQANVLGILLINQIAANTTDGGIENVEQISPASETLQEFYNSSKTLSPEPVSDEQEVFAAINLYTLDQGQTKLFWGGTIWSFERDNQGGAVRDISARVAEQLLELRQQIFE